MSNRWPKAVSLFTGAGGLDLGVEQAGFRTLACIESDPYCCETLRVNFRRLRRKCQVLDNDIRDVDPSVLLAELRLKPGALDLLHGGPPCQAFSQIGKRESLGDERGLLLFEMVRFARAFQPRAILIEQVKGVLTAADQAGKRGGAFDQLIRSLEVAGYVPKWQVLNVADYGVPQLRRRLFIVAMPKPNGFTFPAPTHSPPDATGSLFGLPAYTTVGQALRGLGQPRRARGEIPENSHADVTPQGDRRRIHGVPEGSHLAAQMHLPSEQRRNLTRKDTTKFRRLRRDEPSLTLRCGEIFFHPNCDRYLTPRECMRIHGYPDDYVLKGPIRGRSGQVRHLDQHRQIANSVPPPVAYLLAQSILRTLKCRPSSRSSGTR